MNGFIRQVFQGDPAALADLSYRLRRELLGEKVTFTEHIATFSVGSTSRDPGSLTALGALYGRERYGKEGDGLVLRDDAIIPGSRGVVLLDELDHGPGVETQLSVRHGRRGTAGQSNGGGGAPYIIRYECIRDRSASDTSRSRSRTTHH
jgi:hypothetical protein